jgi:WD40 repeat protein
MKLKIWILILSFLIFGSLSALDAQDDTLSAMGVKWSPDGRWLAANTSSGVWVFDTENLDAEPQVYYEGAEVHLIAFNRSSNELAVVMVDYNVEYVYKNGMVNLDTGEASEADVMQIGGTRGTIGPISAMSQIYELSYTTDGAYGILTMDNVLYLYEPTFHRVDFTQRGTDPEDYIVSVAQVGDTNNFLTLSWSEGDDLRLVNREGGLLSSHEPEHSGDTVYYLDDTRAILPARDGIYIFDFGSDEEELLLAAPEGNYLDASAYFAPTGTLLLGGYGFWQAVNVATAEAGEIVEVESQEEHMHLAAFDFKPDGTQFVSLQSDGVLSIWDMETGELLNSWQAFDNAFSIKWG